MLAGSDLAAAVRPSEGMTRLARETAAAAGRGLWPLASGGIAGGNRVHGCMAAGAGAGAGLQSLWRARAWLPSVAPIAGVWGWSSAAERGSR